MKTKEFATALQTQREEMIKEYNQAKSELEELEKKQEKAIMEGDADFYNSSYRMIIELNSDAHNMLTAINQVGTAIAHLTGEEVNTFWG